MLVLRVEIMMVGWEEVCVWEDELNVVCRELSNICG